MNETLLFALLAVACALLLAVLVTTVLLLLRSGGEKERDRRQAERILSNTDARAEALRQDVFRQSEALRGSLTAALGEMRQSVDTQASRVQEIRFDVTKALSDSRDKADEAARLQTAAVTEAVARMQQSNEQKLEQMRVTVDEKLNATLNDRLTASFQTVSEQLRQVYSSLGEMREISGGITALNRVLAGVKTRGTWAEAQLETILDQIIPGMYEKNFRPAEGRDAVEFAVRIPAQDTGAPTFLPIDSKFPIEDYLRLCDAEDAADADAVKAARQALERRVLEEARTISKYVQPPLTTPFAVMYLGTDALYAEVVSSKAQLADRIHRDYRVMIAGPSTIAALLSTLAMGFRTAALNAKADEVMKLLSAAQVQYERFGDALTKAKRKLDEAGKSLDEASSRNDIIRKKLKNVGTIPLDEADGMLQLGQGPAE